MPRGPALLPPRLVAPPHHGEAVRNASRPAASRTTTVSRTRPFAPWPAEVQHLPGWDWAECASHGPRTSAPHRPHSRRPEPARMERPRRQSGVCPVQQASLHFASGSSHRFSFSSLKGWDCRPSGTTSSRSSPAHRVPFPVPTPLFVHAERPAERVPMESPSSLNRGAIRMNRLLSPRGW